MIERFPRSATQPFPQRRYTRTRSDGANYDKDAHDGYKPHRLYPRYPRRDHDGQDDYANNQSVKVHPPREQATKHVMSLLDGTHLGSTADKWQSAGNSSNRAKCSQIILR
jgi:hypothetical protein